MAMKPYTYSEGMSLAEQKDGAYFERNLLALYFATFLEKEVGYKLGESISSGWYYDTVNNWDGWKRVVSLFDGTCNFHVPDDFDLGTLREIEPVYDGHTTEEKWLRVMEYCGCEMPKGE